MSSESLRRHEDTQTRELVCSFEKCTLPDLRHEDHVRVAWYYLQDQPLAVVLGHLPGKLQRFALSKGAPTKYHETVTFAFTCIVAERVSRHANDSWEAFSAANEDLFDSSLLDRYYSREVLKSSAARRSFVFPRATSPTS